MTSLLSNTFVTPWTVAHLAPLPTGFPRQDTGVGCHFLLQGIFLVQGSNPHLLHWQVGSLPLRQQGRPDNNNIHNYFKRMQIQHNFICYCQENDADKEQNYTCCQDDQTVQHLTVVISKMTWAQHRLISGTQEDEGQHRIICVHHEDLLDIVEQHRYR